jgi:hypothetical protein
VPDVELTLPLDACTPDELVDWLAVADVDDIDAVELAALLDVDLPGMVAALT